MATFRKRGETWTVQISYIDSSGIRKFITKSGFNTKKEANLYASEIELKLSQSSYFKDQNILFYKVINDWLENYGKLKFKESTMDNRSRMLKRVSYSIGDMDISKIKPLDIIKMYHSFLNEGLSNVYVHSIHRTLKTLFKTAQKWKLINHNIMDDVEAPKIGQKSVKTWSIEQVKEFILITKNDRYFTAFLIALYTGLRRGEILNLKWNDLDLKNKMLSVRSGKTKSSERQISLSDNLIDELKKHKVKQNEYKLKLGSGYQDNNLIICTELGTPLIKRNLNRSFYNALKKCSNLPEIRFHDLRHTHATMLLSMGVNPKIVSERLGHSRVNITLDTYSHVLPVMQKETAERLNEALN